MTTLIADVAEELPLLPPTQPRRGMLGLLARGGMVLVGGLAGFLATGSPAAAADCQHSPCCHLAKCRRCAGSCNYSCPSGYHRQRWYCTAGARVIGCGECTTSNSTCWSGTFYCSVWWDDGSC